MSKPAAAPAAKSGAEGRVELELELDAEVTEPQREGAKAAVEAASSFRLAQAALQRNDIGGALAHAEKASALEPSQPDYVTLTAWIRSLNGDPKAMEQAIQTMSKVLLEDPANERALLFRGKLLVRMNRLHDALTDFTELVAANPQHREASTELRMLKQRMGGT